MDPKQTLLDLLDFLFDDERRESGEFSEQEFLELFGEKMNYYRDWRFKEGFEPRFSMLDVACISNPEMREFLKAIVEKFDEDCAGDVLFRNIGYAINLRYGLCLVCGAENVRRGPLGMTSMDYEDEHAEMKLGMRCICRRCGTRFFESFGRDGVFVAANTPQDEPEISDDAYLEIEDGRKVEIHVEGGVVTDVKRPPGIVVKVHDHDDESEEPEVVTVWADDSDLE